ncbi:MAG: ABC transporter substrate-binding protein [Acetobacteraceae bacterium]
MSNNSYVPKGGLSRRQIIQGAGAAGGALSVGLILPHTSWAADAPPPAIVVGQLVPFTGSAGIFGTHYRDAAALAFKQINEAAKAVFGGPIISKVVVADSETLPEPAIAAAKQIITADGAPVLLVGWSSGVTVAVATAVTIPSGVLQVADGATSPLISVLPANQKAHLLFRTSPSDLEQAALAAKLVNGGVFPNYKFSRVATTFINNPYGQGLSNAFTKDFEHLGGKVLTQVPHPEKVQPTYRSELQQALKDKPELLMMITYPAQTTIICKESRDIFHYTSWQFTDANQSMAVLHDVGPATLNGKLGTSPEAETGAPTYIAFAERYKKDYHHNTIPPFTADVYDAAAVVGLAIAKAIADGYTDPKKITGRVLADRMDVVANTPGVAVDGGTEKGLQKGMELIKAGKKISYNGVGGPVDFAPNGDVRRPIGIWKFTETGIDIIKVVPADKIPVI